MQITGECKKVNSPDTEITITTRLKCKHDEILSDCQEEKNHFSRSLFNTQNVLGNGNNIPPRSKTIILLHFRYVSAQSIFAQPQHLS